MPRVNKIVEISIGEIATPVVHVGVVHVGVVLSQSLLQKSYTICFGELGCVSGKISILENILL